MFFSCLESPITQLFLFILAKCYLDRIVFWFKLCYNGKQKYLLEVRRKLRKNQIKLGRKKYSKHIKLLRNFLCGKMGKQ